MTAAQEFAELGQPWLVKRTFQIGATLVEERVLVRALLAVQIIPDTDPPDNKAFETDLFVYLRDVYALLTTLGLFGAFSVLLPYPSRELVLGMAGPIASVVLPKAAHNATVSIPLPAAVTKGAAVAPAPVLIPREC